MNSQQNGLYFRLLDERKTLGRGSLPCITRNTLQNVGTKLIQDAWEATTSATLPQTSEAKTYSGTYTD